MAISKYFRKITLEIVAQPRRRVVKRLKRNPNLDCALIYKKK